VDATDDVVREDLIEAKEVIEAIRGVSDEPEGDFLWPL
jgi:hypothetical protein